MRGECLEGGGGLKGDAAGGEVVEAIEKGGVEGAAEMGQGMELGRVVGVVDGEHAGGGGGGFGEGSGSIEDGDGEAEVVEVESEGEADDAGAGDANVWMTHGLQLWMRVGVGGVRRGI